MGRNIILLLATTVAMQTVAISQSNPLLQYMPEDVSMVVNIDLKRLAGKIPPDAFRQSNIYQQMMKDPAMPFDSLLSDPAKWGVDFSAGILLAVKEQLPGYGRKEPGFHFFLKLSDAETFTRTVKQFGSHDEEGKDGLQVYGTDRILVSGGKISAGWNNDILVVTTATSDEMAKEILKYQHVADTTVMTDTGSIAEEAFDFEGMMEKFKKNQRNFIFELLTPRKSNALTANTHFLSAMSSEADIKIWNGGNSNPLKEKLLPFAPMLEKLEAFGGKNKIALINFENGKIIAVSRSFPEGTVAEIYKKYPVTPQNMDLVRRLPAGTILGIVNMSFHQAMANEMMAKSGLLELLDSLKKDIPFDLGLLPGVFKSHFMIAAIKPANTTEPFMKKGGMELIIALPVADKVKFEKLKAVIRGLLDSLKKGKGEDYKDPGIVTKHNDELLVISLTPETASSFLNNPGTGEVPTWFSTYSKHPMTMSINMREIIQGLLNKRSGDKEEGKKDETTEKVINNFDKLLVYGGQYENGSVNTTMEFRFADQDQNSLKQLLDLLNTITETKRYRYKDDNGSSENGISTPHGVVKEINVTAIKLEEKEPEPPPPPAKPMKKKNNPPKKKG